jgi:peroxiredoxin
MQSVKKYLTFAVVLTAVLFFFNGLVFGQSQVLKDNIYDPGPLKPIDSKLKVKAGDPAPDFTLPSVSGKKISLSQFKGEKNVVLSFVPAAWTPVCSEQWPGYNLLKDVFDEGDAVLLGISVDNVPTLYAWTRQMGSLWFEVLSDFWPHGAVTDKYGVLRSDGFSERAVFVIDKGGIIRAALVMDINRKPDFEPCASALKKVAEEKP